MATIKKKYKTLFKDSQNMSNKCRQIRSSLCGIIADKFILNRTWVRNHITNCPKCQKRLAAFAKVELALSIIKSQTHNLDLLKQANTQAIGVLKRTLRQEPKAKKLQKILPEPTLWECYKAYRHTIANVAACITILLLMKIGVFSAFDVFQSRGKETIKQYYVKNIGEDLTNEIFTT